MLALTYTRVLSNSARGSSLEETKVSLHASIISVLKINADERMLTDPMNSFQRIATAARQTLPAILNLNFVP